MPHTFYIGLSYEYKTMPLNHSFSCLFIFFLDIEVKNWNTYQGERYSMALRSTCSCRYPNNNSQHTHWTDHRGPQLKLQEDPTLPLSSEGICVHVVCIHTYLKTYIHEHAHIYRNIYKFKYI